MLTKLSTLALVSAAATTVTLAATPAQAATINLGGTPFDITTITGTYNDLRAELDSQPWFGSLELATEASFQVGFDLGTPNGISGPTAPLFAYSVQSIFGPDSHFMSTFQNLPEVLIPPLFNGFQGVTDGQFTFAVVGESEPPTSVPEPATILGSLVALGLGGTLKRRLPSSKK